MIKKIFSFIGGGKTNETPTQPRVEIKQIRQQTASVPFVKSNNMNSSILTIINRISWIQPETKTALIGELQTKTNNFYSLKDIRDVFEKYLNVDKATSYKLARTIMVMVDTKSSYKDYVKDHCVGIKILGGNCNCKHCGSLHGRVWPIKSPNIILPPYHIGCTCCISPVVSGNISDPGPAPVEIVEHYKKFQHQFFKVSPECLRDKQIKEILAVLNSSIEQMNFDEGARKKLDAAIKKLEKTMGTQRHNDGIIDECLTSIKTILEPKGEYPTAIKILAMIDEQLIY